MGLQLNLGESTLETDGLFLWVNLEWEVTNGRSGDNRNPGGIAQMPALQPLPQSKEVSGRQRPAPE